MKLDEITDEFCCQLKRRQIEGSLQVSKRTAEFIRTVITHNKHSDATSLIEDTRKIGIKLQKTKPTDLVIGNIVRRVMHIIREERLNELKENEKIRNENITILSGLPVNENSDVFDKERLAAAAAAAAVPHGLHSLLDIDPIETINIKEDSHLKVLVDENMTDGSKKKKLKSWKYKSAVIDGINELIEELDNIPSQIAQYADDQVHAHEVMMTFGKCNSVLQFLEKASKKHPELKVIVAEAFPRLSGHEMAKELANIKIKTTIITDAAIFAMMARVDQVFVGCNAILANGGIIANAGTHAMALAAREHAVPFVVIVGLHKLSPLFPHNPYTTLNDFKSSIEILDYDYLTPDDENNENQEIPKIINPLYDYVPPELINLFITDQGGTTPSFVYRLLSDFYSREDYHLCEDNDEIC